MNTPGQIDESLRRAFESAWEAGASTRIEDHLPASSQSEYLATLEELIHIDLEFAWKQAGSAEDSTDAYRPLVESYLDRFPAINQPSIVQRLLQQELYVRRGHGERPAIEEYCSRFPELLSDRRQAEELLQDAGAVGLPSAATPLQERYRLVAKHGRGGFGEVWRAADAVLGREVAIKRLSPALASQEDHRRRFSAEARTAARLEHPGVVPVYDLIDPDSERPYYAMRFLSGVTMAEAIRSFHKAEDRVSLRSVAGLRLLSAFLTVAKTIQFAHARGVIHRDLKPQNIMLGEYGETVVLDWGLAKNLAVTGADVRGAAANHAKSTSPVAGIGTETVAGAILGTPAYMSPEQAGGLTDEVDERSDVYGLGAILYEVLTGKAPHGSAHNSRALVTHPRSFARGVPRPLEAICLHALSPDPGARYQKVARLAGDIELYLAREPVSVLRESWFARSARYARRHRTLAVALAVVGMSAVLALAMVLAVVVKSNRNLNSAQAQTTAALDKAQANLYLQRLVTAYQEFVDNNNVVQARALLDQCPVERRAWEWHLVSKLCDHDQPQTLFGHSGRVQHAAYSPDDQFVASVDDNGTVLMWDAATGTKLWQAEHKLGAGCVAFTPDGSRLATGGVDADNRGNVRIWDAQSGTLLVDFTTHERLVWSLAFSGDGQRLATGSLDHTARLWNAESLALQRTLSGHQDDVLSVAFDARAERLVTGSKDGTVKMWEVASGTLIRTIAGHTAPVTCVAFSPAATQIASASQDLTVRLWNAEDPGGSRVLSGHREQVESVAFSSTGDHLVSAIRVWDLKTFQEQRILRGHESHVRCVAFSSDATRVVSAGDDFTVRIWDVNRTSPTPRFPGLSIAFDRSGRRIATAEALPGRLAQVRIWNLTSQEELLRVAPQPRIHRLAYSHDGSRLACAHDDGSVSVWDSAEGQLVQRVGSESSQIGLAFSPDDAFLAAGDREGTIRIWTLESTAAPRIVRAHQSDVTALEFSPNGEWLASASFDGTARIWDFKSATERLLLRGHQDKLTWVTFHPDGTRLATSSHDGTIRIWDSTTGELQRSLIAGKFYLNSVAFSPDGKRIASGSDQIIKIWDAATGHQVFSAWGHNCVNEMAFSPDGEWLAVAGTHKQVRLLRGAPVQRAR